MVKFSMGNVLKLPQLLKLPELVSKSSIFRFWCRLSDCKAHLNSFQVMTFVLSTYRYTFVTMLVARAGSASRNSDLGTIAVGFGTVYTLKFDKFLLGPTLICSCLYCHVRKTTHFWVFMLFMGSFSSLWFN
jgi:hypothetical protein